jgi:pimeloyl-ACP methyl ester carboxylesterase
VTNDRPQIVFVDGIGGRPHFRAPLLRHFAARGHACHHVDYRPSRESLDAIRARLGDRLAAIAANGPYVLIGYSFGGVLARSVLTTRAGLAQPLRLVLVASPMHSLRMCRAFAGWPVFRWLTGDCGALLASESRMRDVALPPVRTTCIHGRTGPRARGDGMVAVAEIGLERFDDVVAVRASHPFIPTSLGVIDAIEARVSAGD